MKICICTIIKNEHDYLDEYIQYHLNAGIDHIFFFEDYGTETHKDITDKYRNNVTLQHIDTILDDHARHTAAHYKRWVHGVYFQFALWHIKTNFDYNWCFATDVDEFISFKDRALTPENLRNFLEDKNDFDAIWLHWQNFNANGHIHKPDYSKVGVVSTYTKECGMFTKSDKWTTSKFVYNLNNYEFLFCRDQHRIYPKCHYTEYPDVIYLRHYITKSWEEFIWKLKMRGTFSVNHRPIEDFFKLNPELEDKKNKLLSELK